MGFDGCQMMRIQKFARHTRQWSGLLGVFVAVKLMTAAPTAGFLVPAGFEVTRFAGDDLAHNIHAMTLDARGDVVVAGPGYIKTLLDENGDGAADRVRVFSEFPRSG